MNDLPSSPSHLHTVPANFRRPVPTSSAHLATVQKASRWAVCRNCGAPFKPSRTHPAVICVACNLEELEGRGM